MGSQRRFAEPWRESGSLLTVIPIGGCGEFGKNLTAYFSDGTLLLVDCGIQMPDDLMPGIEHAIPDFEPVLARFGPPAAVLLTHGHEDHIGAVGYLLSLLDQPIPVYGRALTLRLAERRLDKLGIAEKLRDLREVMPGQRVLFGPGRRAGSTSGATLQVTPLAVPHSIPESCALLIETVPEDATQTPRRVLHTGDYKLDELGEQALELLAAQPVDLLVGDSTNAQVPGRTPSERAANEALASLLEGGHRGRIVIALFSSHLDRIQHFAHACQKAGRRLCLLGRGIHDAVAAAERARALSFPPDVLVGMEDAANLPPSQLAVLCTGTQGERMAALGKLVAALDGRAPSAFGRLRLEPGDTVVVSARIIPGNERPVGRLLDRLVLAGIHVHTGLPYAVSGHASQEDLRALITTVRPRAVLPVHGSPRQTHAHAALAESLGFEALRCQDGDVLSIDDAIEVTDRLEVGTIFVEGTTIGAVGWSTLKTRLRLSFTGVVVVAMDATMPGQLLVSTMGVQDSGPALAALCRDAERAAAAALRSVVGDMRSWGSLPESAGRAAVRAVRTTFHRQRGLKPTILSLLGDSGPGGEPAHDDDFA